MTEPTDENWVSRQGRTIDLPVDRNGRFTAIATGGDWIAISGGTGEWGPSVNSRIELIKLSALTEKSTAGVSALPPDVRAKLDASFKDGTAKPAELETLVRDKVLDARTPLHTIDRLSAGLFAMAFSPDGKLLAAAGGDRTVRLYETASWKEVGSLRGHADVVTDVSFSADGSKLLSASWDNSAVLWDVATRAVLHRVASHTQISHARLTPDGKHAITGGQACQYWDMEAERLVDGFSDHCPVEGLAVSPAGLIAVADQKGTGIIWDSNTRKLVASKNLFLIAYGVEFKDGDSVRVNGVGGVREWNFRTGATTPAKHLPFGTRTKDGKYVATHDASWGTPEGNLVALQLNMGTTEPVLDPSEQYVVYATKGGDLSFAGFTVESPGKIMVLDVNKCKELVDIQAKIGGNH